MIDVSTMGPPTEYLMCIIFVTAIFAGFASYLTSAIRKGDYDADNKAVSNWGIKYVIGSIAAAIIGGAIAIVGTPMIMEGLDIRGAGMMFYSVATGIVSIILTRWFVIFMHEGPAEFIKDLKNKIRFGKDVADIVKDEFADNTNRNQ